MVDKTDTVPASSAEFRCGFVALVGRPNVGKSTLLNRLVGQKVSITSRKPQTTRHRILGINTTAAHQCIYVDTPGLHRGRRRVLNRSMNRTVANVVGDVDVVLLIIEALRWTAGDEQVLAEIRDVGRPLSLVVNKVDRARPRSALLPFLAESAVRADFGEVLPVSAYNGENIERLEASIASYLPPGVALFGDDMITDRSERFLAAELIREQLIGRLGEELPYRIGVEIDRFEDCLDRRGGARANIHATIWVESAGQKGIVIGKQGRLLKAVGSAARLEMESMFSRKVWLELWVKVREGWSDDESAVRSLGYSE